MLTGIFIALIGIAFLLLAIITLQIINNLKLSKMNQDLEKIKSDLIEANQTLSENKTIAVKIDKDVDKLTALVEALPNDSEAIAQIKELAASLKKGTTELKGSLVITDEKTEDEDGEIPTEETPAEEQEQP